MKKLFIAFYVLVHCVLLLHVAKAAVIYGTIYDLSIEKIKSAVVEIDTKPAQRLVSADGTYSFDLPPGRYTINAFYRDGGAGMFAQENITIVDDGIYVLDLFLYPDLADDESLYSDLDFSIDQPFPGSESPSYVWSLVLFFGAALIFSMSLFLSQRRRLKKNAQALPEDKDVASILDAIKKNGGRMLQKDLRKSLPYSEAKISLIITELEAGAKIKRIKKGRGNLLVVSKK